MAADVVVYGTRYCPYCMRARQLLSRKGVAFREVDLTMDERGRSELARRVGSRLVPQIFINGRAVGGFDDIDELDRRGELERLLSEPNPPAVV
jgi:glutaredoxin 3